MKKIKLLITSAALLVGGGLLSFSANNIIKANAAIVGSENTPMLTQVTDMNSFKSGDYVIGNIVDDNFIGDYTNSKYTFVKSSDARLLTFTEISSDDSGIYFTIFDTEENFFLGYDKSTNFTKLTAVKDDSGYWYVDIGSDGKIKIISKKDDTRAILYRNGSDASSKRFAPYADSNVKNNDEYTYPYIYYLSTDSIEVTLHYGDGLVENYSIKSGTTLQELLDSNNVKYEKENYRFDGWYYDSEGKEMFDTSVSIEESAEVYAHYTSHDDLFGAEYFSEINTKTSLKATREISKSNVEIDFEKLGYTSADSNADLVGDNKTNNSSKFGLSSSDWNVIADKGNGNAPSFKNDSHELRLYRENKISFTNLNGFVENFVLKMSQEPKYLKISVEGKEIMPQINDSGYLLYDFSNLDTNTFEISSTATGTGTSNRLDLEKGFYIMSDITTISNVSIRFGTSIRMDKFVRDSSYGVILADGTKIEDGDDLNSLFAESNTTSASDYVAYLKQQGINVYQEPFADTEIAYVSTPNSSIALDETDPNAKYAQYALVIDGLLEHMNQTFAAVCYMEYEGQLYLMKEARHSINSVVDAYLADEDTMSTLTDNSVAILKALNAM